MDAATSSGSRTNRISRSDGAYWRNRTHRGYRPDGYDGTDRPKRDRTHRSDRCYGTDRSNWT